MTQRNILGRTCSLIPNRAAMALAGVGHRKSPVGLLQRLQREQVVAVDQNVVEAILLGDAVRRMLGERRIFEQDAGLQLRALVHGFCCGDTALCRLRGRKARTISSLARTPAALRSTRPASKRAFTSRVSVLRVLPA